MLKTASEATATLLLPVFQDSVKYYSSKHVQELETQVKNLHKHYDEISYTNKTLEKKLADLKTLGMSLDIASAESNVEKANQRIIEIEELTKEAYRNLQDANSQKDRLTKVISICLKNKKHNQLWIKKLNYLVQNINKVIAEEEEKTLTNKRKLEELTKISTNFLKAFEEKIDTHQKMIKHVRHQKGQVQRVEKKVDTAYNRMEQSAFITAEKLQELQKSTNQALVYKQKLEQIEKNHKNIYERAEELEEEVISIKNTIGLDFESKKFNDFMYGISKSDELEKDIHNRNYEIEALKQELQQKQSFVETLRKAKMNLPVQENKTDTPYGSIIEKQTLINILKEKLMRRETAKRMNDRLIKLILQARMTLNNICKKAKVNIETERVELRELPHEEIISKVEEKLAFIKESLSPQEYEEFLNGKFDFNQVYAKAGIDFAISKSYIFEEDSIISPSNYYKQGNKLYEASD